eukprot:CAMPEP_0172376992 /NCGR_PEP_ID=MMETSP1060-20121228/68668_1 /TAXON_ID=37318 /ORGANISM="Pseudo-nitzschia pungens, Strain cf. cingulata" /LENGTH=394 /DNA_ID=CAMNT_0013104659 /DNA_START=65 /DNA_END=1249 /DNA_ORIENTATION=-
MAMMDIASVEDLRVKAKANSKSNSKSKSKSKSKSVLLFGADWHEACSMLETVLGALSASLNDDILFGKVDAESAAATELTETLGVTMVPTVVLLLLGAGDKNDLASCVSERLEGESLADPSALTLAVQRLAAKKVERDGPLVAAATATATRDASEEAPSSRDALTARLSKLVRMDTVVLFMKGIPDKPRCGFSRQAVEFLAVHKIPYASFDIMEDNDVRQGLKEYSEWPTYPQIYVRGELMGGLDILKETAAGGSLLDDWEIADLVASTSTSTSASAASAPSREESLNDRLTKLVNRHPVMLFMKGLPSNPKCGFSRQTVELLDSLSLSEDGTAVVSYDAFDILSDEEVRQGLKQFSDWPTYPQLYVNGELVGGLDILRELDESGDLLDVLKGA